MKMKPWMIFSWTFCILSFSLYADSSHLSSLYASIDPTSVEEHFAFYDLYPETKEGKQALEHAWKLLSGNCEKCDPKLKLPKLAVQPIIELVHRSREENTPTLSEEQLKIIQKIAQNLKNRSLKGFDLWSTEEILKLEPQEIDLARGLLIAEIGIKEPLKVQSYEASLDLMALQVLARVSSDATDLEKVRAINDYIFSEMKFRFPPVSLHAKDIDIYTFLPSVLDQRKGVCLGVSILYLSLAQRLGLPLEIITPPGHIYVRYNDGNGNILNIETTARGIDVPSEHYLGMETKALQTRNIKEVIGLAFMNRAAVYWQKGDPEKAVSLYETAKPYFQENDYLLNMFLGFNYLFVGKEKEGKKLLQKIQGKTPDHAISKDTISEDYLLGKVDEEGILAVYSEVDSTRSSIFKKRERIEKTLKKHPHFRQGVFHLAITYLQLGREKEALPILEKYATMNPEDSTANYYLSAIHFQRHNFLQSWKYFKKAEAIVKAKNHNPHALKELKKALLRVSPI